MLLFLKIRNRLLILVHSKFLLSQNFRLNSLAHSATKKRGCPKKGILIKFLKLINELSVNLSHMSDKVENLVRVTNLVVIPRYNLNECIGKSDTCLRVEDRCTSVTKEV